MRDLEPDYMLFFNTANWYEDLGYIRAAQPGSGRYIILPKDHGMIWRLIEKGFNLGDLVREASGLNPGITDREITGIIAELEKLRLIKISHPCWVEPTDKRREIRP